MELVQVPVTVAVIKCMWPILILQNVA